MNNYQSPPLKGLTIIDLSRVLAGPFASMMLGDLGAEVIKVERPDGGDQTRAWTPPDIGGESAYYLSLNRNKRSLSLNLKCKEGQEVIKKLVEKGDVLIENFLPGGMDKFGLGYESLKEINPGLIYCSVTGYGQNGPWKNRPAYDIILQGEGGLMSITGMEDSEPTRIGVALVDIITSLYAVQGIMAAVIAREKTGQGQKLDVALYDCELSTLSYMAAYYFATGKSPKRMGSKHPTISPYQAFKTRDDYLVLGVGSQRIWEKFCKAINYTELLEDPRFLNNSNRVNHREELEAILNQIFEKKTTSEWLEVFKDKGIPVTGVNDMEQIFSSEQVMAREMLQTINHPVAGEIKQIGIPLKFEKTPGKIEKHPPMLGEHTTEILQEIGYSLDDIEKMKSNQIT